MIGTIIRGILLGNAGFTGLAGSSVYPLRVPQGKPLPAVTYQRISTSPTDCKESVSALDNLRVQLTVFSEQYEELEGISHAVRAALDGYTGTVLQTNVTGKFLNETDLFDNNAEIYHRAIDFNFTINR
jgi:hypothetical protein